MTFESRGDKSAAALEHHLPISVSRVYIHLISVALGERGERVWKGCSERKRGKKKHSGSLVKCGYEKYQHRWRQGKKLSPR